MKKPYHPNPKNINCLEGWVCPLCGYTNDFQVSVSTITTLYDDGTDDCSDVEWDDDSYARCGGCNHEATVAFFTQEN